MTIIKIGHSAYRGTNALRFCFSKAQAIRVLCNRGMPRAEARLAIKNLTTIKNACITINYEICELADMTEIFADPALKIQYGYYAHDSKVMRSAWKNAPEL